MTCGHVAWRVYRLLTNSANNPEMAGPGKLYVTVELMSALSICSIRMLRPYYLHGVLCLFRTALLEPGQAHVGPNLRNALGKCAANSDNTLCVCAIGEQCKHVAQGIVAFGTGSFTRYMLNSGNTKMLLQAKKLYTVLIRTQTPPGQPLQASHYAILYVNSDASRVYVYQAFQNIASLEVTGWWTPADLLKAFTLMVTPAKKAPVGQVVLTEDDMDVLRAFKSDDQPYVNAIVSVAIAGPLPMPEDRCQQLVDMSETDFRLQGCQAMQYVQWGAEGCEGAPN